MTEPRYIVVTFEANEESDTWHEVKDTQTDEFLSQWNEVQLAADEAARLNGVDL